jgi:hypothetical protein
MDRVVQVAQLALEKSAAGVTGFVMAQWVVAWYPGGEERGLPVSRGSRRRRVQKSRAVFAQLIDEIERGVSRSMLELAVIPLRDSGEFDAPAVHARRLRGV